MATWRDNCRPIIRNVIQSVGRDDMKALRRALRDAYPYGERAYHPYKIWCDEIRAQLGLKSGGPSRSDLDKLDDFNRRNEDGDSVAWSTSKEEVDF